MPDTVQQSSGSSRSQMDNSQSMEAEYTKQMNTNSSKLLVAVVGNSTPNLISSVKVLPQGSRSVIQPQKGLVLITSSASLKGSSIHKEGQISSSNLQDSNCLNQSTLENRNPNTNSQFSQLSQRIKLKQVETVKKPTVKTVLDYRF